MTVFLNICLLAIFLFIYFVYIWCLTILQFIPHYMDIVRYEVLFLVCECVISTSVLLLLTLVWTSVYLSVQLKKMSFSLIKYQPLQKKKKKKLQWIWVSIQLKSFFERHFSTREVTAIKTTIFVELISFLLDSDSCRFGTPCPSTQVVIQFWPGIKTKFKDFSEEIWKK